MSRSRSARRTRRCRRELGRILARALEKDRNLRYQTATDLKTELLRLKRDTDSGGRRAAELHDSRPGASAKPTEKSIAVLYFENLSGVKEDEYFRDGITEDIITELSKIKTLKVFPRPTILPYRDKAVTAQQVGRELSAAFVLGGSLRRAGTRLRINTQLMDAKTDFPVWSERYDREMADVFEVQDEIARKIAEALRVTLSPQEQQELAARPTENLQAYDLYLRGKSYARRLTRQDLEFALQMFENAVTLDPMFALAHAANAIFCAQYYANFQRDAAWGGRAKAAADKAIALQPELPDVQVAQAWIRYIDGDFADAIQRVRQAIARKPNCEGAYYLLGRALFAAGRYQEVADIADAAVEAAGDDYSVYVPIINALGRSRQGRDARQLPPAARAGAREPPPEGAGGRARPRAAREPATPRWDGRRSRSARWSSPGPCARTTRPCSTTAPARTAS